MTTVDLWQQWMGKREPQLIALESERWIEEAVPRKLNRLMGKVAAKRASSDEAPPREEVPADTLNAFSAFVLLVRRFDGRGNAGVIDVLFEGRKVTTWSGDTASPIIEAMASDRVGTVAARVHAYRIQGSVDTAEWVLRINA